MDTLDLVGGYAFRERPGDTTPSVVAKAMGCMEASVKAYFREEEFSMSAFSEDLLAAARYANDAVKIAKAMSDRNGYDLNDEFVELIAGWDDCLGRAREVAVRDWVAEQGMRAPFEGIARVRVESTSFGFEDRHPLVGFAYRDDHYDLSGNCIVVSDDAPRPVKGGRIIAWEKLLDVSAPTEEDVATNEVRLEENRVYARTRAKDAAVEQARRARADASAEARAAWRNWTPEPSAPRRPRP